MCFVCLCTDAVCGCSLQEKQQEPLSTEGTILESILNHVCSTLGPEELLEVLPDDGDLSLYISTIEVSVRLDDAREQQKASSGHPPSP